MIHPATLAQIFLPPSTYPLAVAPAMLSKRARGYDEADLPPAQRLCANIADLVTGNDISAARGASLFRDATHGGNTGMRRLGMFGHAAKNIARDLRRKLVKGSRWPNPYVATITSMDPKKQDLTTSKVFMLLPHELIGQLVKLGDPAALFAHADMDPVSYEVLVEAAGKLRLDPARPLLGLSLWIDGVAAKWDRSKSFDMFSLGFPGLPEPWTNVRLPPCAAWTMTLWPRGLPMPTSCASSHGPWIRSLPFDAA